MVTTKNTKDTKGTAENTRRFGLSPFVVLVSFVVFSPARLARRWQMAAAAVGLAGLLLIVSPAAAYADARSDARAQVRFGILMAQRNLWREAFYRWQRAVEIDPSYAAAWNNLAVAYEQRGDFERARDAYEKARRLDSNSPHIQLNQDLFRELHDRIGS